MAAFTISPPGNSVLISTGPAIAQLVPPVQVQTAPIFNLTLGTPSLIQVLNGSSNSAPVSIQVGAGPALSADGLAMEAYQNLDQRTHVYMRPDMYIGSDEPAPQQEWIYDITSKKIIETETTFVQGLRRLLLEILSNASDAANRSRRAGVDPKLIRMDMTQSTITITSYGIPIRIEVEPKSGLYLPEFVFGTLLTGSNFTDEQHEIGKNGIGAKAVNIYSKRFSIRVLDAVRKLSYFQQWKNNMLERSDPLIEIYNGSESSVTVSYFADFARFHYAVPAVETLTSTSQGPIRPATPIAAEGGMITAATLAAKTKPVEVIIEEPGYTREAWGLFLRDALDTSFTAKIPVVFNGTTYNVANIRDYAEMYFGEIANTGIIHYQWPIGVEIIKKAHGEQASKIPGIAPLVEMIILDTPDEGRHVSFVNCLMTREGGVHVNAAMKAACDTTVSIINESQLKQLAKYSKKAIDNKEKRANTINIGDVKPHVSLVLAVRVVNPKFKDGQTKSNLASPTPKIDIPEEELNAIGKWKLTDRLFATLEAKQFANMAKTDGKLRRYVRTKKGVDANNAGKEGRENCFLCITEGDAGLGYVNKLIALMAGGRDNFGTMPERGKGLNVMNADRFALEKNVEIGELKKILGLCEGLDYMDPCNFRQLRYGGGIIIMADSDLDGKHIIGLMLSYFHCRFPSLLARGYVRFWRTPIVRVNKGKQVKRFYFEQDYITWLKTDPTAHTWTPSYFKGLGTSEKEHIVEDAAERRLVSCYYDRDAPGALKLAFDDKLSNSRKEWLQRWTKDAAIQDVPNQPISWFINQEMICFSYSSNIRSIPRLTDGFIDSTRKVIFGAHKEWAIGAGKDYKKLKVAQFAGHIAKVAAYHHGEGSLEGVIFHMAQDFVGANNISWFEQGGEFGTRWKGGKDHAPARYPTTWPSPLMSYILRKEDQPLLKYKQDEDKDIEPETYWPVIIGANNHKGMGTGWSSTMVNHNPLDIIKYFRMKLQGVPDEKLPNVMPWYRGFTGTIRLIDRRRKKKATIISQVMKDGQLVQEVKEVTLSPEDEAPVNFAGERLDGVDDEKDLEDELRPLLSMQTFGKFHIMDDGTIVVTELPIGLWSLTYHKWLESLVEAKRITGFRDMCGDETVFFEIYNFCDTEGDRLIPSFTNLKLRRTVGMSNMVFLNENDRPIRYDTMYDILEAFYVRRLPIYADRKAYILNKLAEDIVLLREKMRFYQAILSGELKVNNRKKADVIRDALALGIRETIAKEAKILGLTEDKVLEQATKINQKLAEIAVKEAIRPEDMWISDLNELEDAYRKHYGFPKEVIHIQIGAAPPPKRGAIPFPMAITVR